MQEWYMLQLFRAQSIAHALTLLDQDGHFSRDTASKAESKSAPHMRESKSLSSFSPTPGPTAMSKPVHAASNGTEKASHAKGENDMAAAGQAQKVGGSESTGHVESTSGQPAAPSNTIPAIMQPERPSSAVSEASDHHHGTAPRL
jgi:hypothetical protein